MPDKSSQEFDLVECVTSEVTFRNFIDEDRIDVAERKAQFVQLWVLLGFSWKRVLESEEARELRLSKAMLMFYLQSENFKRAIDRVSVLKRHVAEDVMFELMGGARKEEVRLKAAEAVLGAENPEKWDSGVRRQKLANQGSWINTILKAGITEKDLAEVEAADPFLAVEAEPEKKTIE